MSNKLKIIFVDEWLEVLKDIMDSLINNQVPSNDLEKRYIKSMHAIQDAMTKELGIKILIQEDKLYKIWENKNILEVFKKY